MSRNIEKLFELGMKRKFPRFQDWDHFGFKVNVGPGDSHIPNTSELDLPDYDANFDAMPYEDGTVDVIHCYHVLEHLTDPIYFLTECQRVMSPYGIMNIVVPYYMSQMAYQDITHVKFFTLETFEKLFENKYYKPLGIEWELEVIANAVFGIVDRNLCMMTQLRKIK